MNLGLAAVLAAVGFALIYKGYTNVSWPQFYSVVFQGKKV